MRATEILMSEHRIIEVVLASLEAMADQCKSQGVLDREAASQAIFFLKSFADKCHHGKEEGQLFPLLETKGFPREGGPTGVMLQEHELGRIHIRGMADAVEADKLADPNAQRQFIQHAKGYIHLLREHIQKEDRILFPMADRSMTSEDQEHLLASFQRVESQDIGEGTHEALLKLADELALRYGIDKMACQAAAAEGLPCCHQTHPH
jgi:hemerythrin-like domain-containing protein